jgi:HlyD family secretion protein
VRADRGAAIQRIFYSLIALAAVALVGWAIVRSSRPAPIEVVRPERGTIRESFREAARTRLAQTWKISTQVAGRVGRIDLEPGDSVARGQTLAEFDPTPFETAVAQARADVAELQARLDLNADTRLDRAALEEAEAVAEGAERTIEAGQARHEAAQARLEFAQKELERFAKLLADGVANPSDYDSAKLNADTALKDQGAALADLAAARSALAARRLAAQKAREAMARRELERKEIQALYDRAKARLKAAEHDLSLARVVSPIDGVVLERYDRGEKPMPLGADLLLLGDPKEIEVIADVLSEDALRLERGSEVELESTAGALKLAGRVERIEPQGFTKLSSLGVEQQRVNVIVAIENPPPRLQVEYRLHARFFTGRKDDALLVPRFSVLQAPDRSYYVYVVEGGAIARRPVRLGLRGDLWIEIAEGLSESDRVVAKPDSSIEEGAAVAPVETAR